MFDRTLSWPKKHFSLNPWVYFFVFLAANTLLSFGPLTSPLRWTVFFIGILFPLVLGLRNAVHHRGPAAAAPQKISAWPVPLSLWLLFIALLLFTHFYRLTSLPFWLINDEGNFGAMTLNLKNHWTCSLGLGESRAEPLFPWLCVLIFRWIPPSLFSVRLIPGLFSIAAGLAAYAAGRKYFSPVWAWAFAWLCALSFWAFTLSRFYMPTVLPPLFELAVFGCLGGFLSAASPWKRWSYFAGTVFFACLGFYSSVTLAVVWLGAAFLLAMECFYQKRLRARFFFLFLAVTALTIWPMVLAKLGGGFSHVRESWGGWFPWKSDMAYLKALFWDSRDSYPFGSDWGGLFNPLLGALILTGLIYVFTLFDFYALFCAGVLLLLGLLPGFLSGTLELYRLTNAYIFFMAAAVCGIFSLVSFQSKIKSLAGITLLLALSSALDIYNFVEKYSDIQRAPPVQQWRSPEYFNAYQILKELKDQTGPVDLFTGWNPDYDNKTLNLAVYSFNALENPDLSPARAAWGAFVVDVDYLPFLRKRFPHLRSYLLNPALPATDPHHLLGIFLVPLSDMTPPVLAQWMSVNQACGEISARVLNKNPREPWSVFEKDYAGLAEREKTDPFLAAVLWEKAASFRVMDGNFAAAAADYQQSIQKGYPVPHLSRDLKIASYLSKTSQHH